jgi:N-acetylglucosamine kinase-like BadF-type ATPase
MRCVLGVDGGNSKTLAVVADERGTILGIGRSGNSNYQGIGLEAAMGAVDAAVEGALQSASLERSSISSAFCALAGADLREDFDRLIPALATLILAPVMELENDSIAALWSGTDEPDAVVVVWGAGTNGAGRNRAGMKIRLPALGSISGDWGGGGDFGREAIWCVARAHDGRGNPTLLSHLVLDALDIDTVDEMIRRLYVTQISPGQIIALAPLVFSAADAGDPVATEVVARGGKEVATTARALLERLDLLGSPVPVVLAGGMFRAESPIFNSAIRHALEQSAPCARIVRPDVEPVVGAALAALNLLGVPVDTAVRARARATYRHSALL